MMRLRVLSLLALTIATLVFLYSKAELSALVIPYGSAWILWAAALLLLLLVSALSVVSSVVLIFLSFFAIKPEEDGSFVVNDDSFYGVVLMWIAKMDYSGQTESFCKVFWQINITLFMIGLALGCMVLMFFYALPFLYLLGIATIWNFVKWPLLVVVVIVFGVAVSAVFCYIIVSISKTLADTQFGGVTLENFYRRYLCPKIRIK